MAPTEYPKWNLQFRGASQFRDSARDAGSRADLSKAIQPRERIDWIDFEDLVSSKGGEFQPLPLRAILHSRLRGDMCDFMLSDAKQERELETRVSGV